MTRQLFPRVFLGVAMTALALLFATGCFTGPGQSDEGTDTVSLLKIDIPASATNISDTLTVAPTFSSPTMDGGLLHE